MTRLRNASTGAVVSCTQETAARLGHGWLPAEAPAEKSPEPKKPAPAKRAAKKPAPAGD